MLTKKKKYYRIISSKSIQCKNWKMMKDCNSQCKLMFLVTWLMRVELRKTI